MSKDIKNDSVSLKELRQHLPDYIEEVSKGRSFTVVKRSRAIFQIVPIGDEGEWQTVVDFTDVQPDGVNLDDVLQQL